MINTGSWTLLWSEHPAGRAPLGPVESPALGLQGVSSLDIPQGLGLVLVCIHCHALGDLREHAQAGVPISTCSGPSPESAPGDAPVPTCTDPVRAPGLSSVSFSPVLSLADGPLSSPGPSQSPTVNLVSAALLPPPPPSPFLTLPQGRRGQKVEKPLPPPHVQPAPQLAPGVDHSRKQILDEMTRPDLGPPPAR